MLVPTLAGDVPLDKGSTTCIVTGWGGQFVLLASFAWTCVFARVLMLVLTRGLPVSAVRARLPRMHALAWGVPRRYWRASSRPATAATQGRRTCRPSTGRGAGSRVT